MEWWNASVKVGMDKSPNERWDKSVPRWTRELKIFGEMGVVRKGGLQRKVLDKGFDGMMVGYAEDSGAGVYRMYNLKTGKVSCTRDIKWLSKSYGEYLKSEKGRGK